MNKFESEIFQSNHPLISHILLWCRYVDDILCVWVGSRELIEDFLDFRNSLYPSIKFSVGEGGGKISFLDLEITIQDCEYMFDIYRRPTATDVTIHGPPMCPLCHKMAAFHCYIHRLIFTPLTTQAFNSEGGIMNPVTNPAMGTCFISHFAVSIFGFLNVDRPYI